jgi:hypothetical protein
MSLEAERRKQRLRDARTQGVRDALARSPERPRTQAQVRATVTRAQTALRVLMLHDPAKVAAVLRAEDLPQVREFIRDAHAWLKELEAALARRA